MPNSPQFFIIAGPNGAGKSTNGHLYISAGTSIFNGDQVFADLVAKFPTIAPDRLQGGVAKKLEDARNEALAAKKDFAFESNYSTDLATEITNTFKKNGYQTNLIYFGLDTLMESALRVRDRKIMGGHGVSQEVIQYNFEEGVKRVNQDLDLFDNILFIDTKDQDTRVIVLVDKKNDLQLNLKEAPSWYNNHFRPAIDVLPLKRIKTVREIFPEQKRGRRR